MKKIKLICLLIPIFELIYVLFSEYLSFYFFSAQIQICILFGLYIFSYLGYILSKLLEKKIHVSIYIFDFIFFSSKYLIYTFFLILIFIFAVIQLMSYGVLKLPID